MTQSAYTVRLTLGCEPNSRVRIAEPPQRHHDHGSVHHCRLFGPRCCSLFNQCMAQTPMPTNKPKTRHTSKITLRWLTSSRAFAGDLASWHRNDRFASQVSSTGMDCNNT